MVTKKMHAAPYVSSQLLWQLPQKVANAVDFPLGSRRELQLPFLQFLVPGVALLQIRIQCLSM